MQTLEIRLIHGQLVGKFPGNLGWLLPPEVATHALPPEQLAGGSNMYAGFGPFMRFKFWHRQVLLLDFVV